MSSAIHLTYHSLGDLSLFKSLDHSTTQRAEDLKPLRAATVGRLLIDVMIIYITLLLTLPVMLSLYVH